MHEGLCRENARRKAKEPRTVAAFSSLIQVTREDFLLDARRVASGRLPAACHVDGVEFLMFLVVRHCLFLLRILTIYAAKSCPRDEAAHRAGPRHTQPLISRPAARA